MNLRSFRIFCCLGTLILPSISDWAQAPAPPTLQPRTALVQPAETLGVNDLLELTVSYCPELSRNFRIAEDGSLHLPLLPSPIPAAGRTPAEVKDLLAAALTSNKVLFEPTVDVSVVEYRSRPVSVFGAVNTPLTFQATGTTTLLDALTRAGGLKATAGSTIFLTRTAGDGSHQVQTIPMGDVTNGTAAVADIRLHGGEEIRVPEASSIFVVGNVRRPGMHSIQSESEMTVVKAISISEGLDSFTAKTGYIYRVTGAGQPRREIPVQIGDIMARKAPDIALRSDDILYVPSANGKKIASKILAGMAGFGQSAGAALIYR
jgi:polysaccharide export outer membrane protein